MQLNSDDHEFLDIPLINVVRPRIYLDNYMIKVKCNVKLTQSTIIVSLERVMNVGQS